jgi:SAM-dependent methyltransferase
MVPLEYWLLRSIRRSLPEGFIDFIHDRGIFRTPGEETHRPKKTARWYGECAQARGQALDGKTVCVVGFGGSFGVGVHLLELGARRVILLRDKYFTVSGDSWTPDPNRLVVLRGHLEPYAQDHPGTADFVVSRAVFEHVDNVDSLVRACFLLTKPGGLNFHLVDLRDHFFKYPFEMLSYSATTWRRWLNASNNLNRLRLPDYERIFGRVFGSAEIEVLTRLHEEFRRARPRVRSEFLTGDEDVDAAARILVTAAR